MRYVARLNGSAVDRIVPVRDTVTDPVALAAAVLGVSAEDCALCGDGAPVAAVGWRAAGGEFAPEWEQIGGAALGPDGSPDGYRTGFRVWRDGRIFESRNLQPNVDDPLAIPTTWAELAPGGGYVHRPPAGWQWQPGEDVTEDGETWWRVTQAISAPPSEFPAAYVQITGPGGEPITPPVGEWAPNQAVVAGDLRTWQGITYVCLQPHTTLAGWEPPNVPALWGVAP